MRPGGGAGAPEAPTEGGKYVRRPITAHAVLLRGAILARSLLCSLYKGPCEVSYQDLRRTAQNPQVLVRCFVFGVTGSYKKTVLA